MKHAEIMSDAVLKRQYLMGLGATFCVHLLTGLLLPGIVPYLWVLQWVWLLPVVLVLWIIKKKAAAQGMLIAAALMFLFDTVICFGGFYPWMG